MGDVGNSSRVTAHIWNTTSTLYGGFGLSLGYGHMMTEVVDNKNLALRYYDVANVDIAFAVKMYENYFINLIF